MERQEVRFKFSGENFTIHTHILDRKKKKNLWPKNYMKSTRKGEG